VDAKISKIRQIHGIEICQGLLNTKGVSEEQITRTYGKWGITTVCPGPLLFLGIVPSQFLGPD